MNEQVVIALIAAIPPSLAAIFGYLATKRTIMRSVGTRRGFSIARGLARLDSKIDRVDAKVAAIGAGQSDIVERLSRLEERADREWRAS